MNNYRKDTGIIFKFTNTIKKDSKRIKKGQLNKFIKLSYKTPLVGSRSNRFWKDLKKFNAIIY